MQRPTTDTPTDLADRLNHVADELRRAGVLTDPAWRDALRAVPRHLFIPSHAWVNQGTKLRAIDRDRDPDAWWEAVYSPSTPILTQFDDTAGPPTDHAEPSSSCPAPKVQFQLLHALDLRDGMTVLEIGTGTGWNAALLAHRLRDQAVISIEIDPDITAQARAALAAAGYHPAIHCADGSHGYPLAAPFDRVISTCAVSRVPYAWVAQTRPGGIIVTPWALPAGTGGDPLARLTVHPDGTASGRFVGSVGFMRLRQQRHARGQPPPGIREPAPAGTVTATTTIDPVAFLIGSDAPLPARLSLGQSTYGLLATGNADEVILWISDPDHASWARVTTRLPFDGTPLPDGTVSRVEQYGPRRLWDQLEPVHRWWRHAGRPDRLRFGLTVTPDAQLVWLDRPSQPVFRLPPTPPPTFLGTTVTTR